MFRQFKLLLLLAIPFGWGACGSIHEDLDPCEIYLEFRFDYNMEYTCSFIAQVPSVDVFIFDEEGKYLFTKQASTSTLIGGNRMALADDLDFGTYKVLTVGGLNDTFRLSTTDGQNLTPGVTTLEEVQLALRRSSNTVSHEFPHVWFGEAIEITYTGGMTESKVWLVSLVRETNNFTIALSSTVSGSRATRAEEVPYTFEIVTPEAAIYGYDNSPLRRTTTTYVPHTLTPGTEEGSLSVGYLNTVRLFYRNVGNYRLVIRDTKTQEEVWNYDLMVLLENTKPAKPDGTTLPMQEYLDRQGEWHLVILHRGGPGSDDAFLAIAVQVNGWILWLSDIEM